MHIYAIICRNLRQRFPQDGDQRELPSTNQVCLGVHLLQILPSESKGSRVCAVQGWSHKTQVGRIMCHVQVLPPVEWYGGEFGKAHHAPSVLSSPKKVGKLRNVKHPCQWQRLHPRLPRMSFPRWKRRIRNSSDCSSWRLWPRKGIA